MLSFIQNIIPTVVVLGVLIFIHELGHFLVAKLSGVKVEKFSLGFGPELLKVDYRGTQYVLSLVPFGGYVKMAGETFEDRQGEQLQPSDFLAQSTLKRFWIIFTGPLMNYLLAFVFIFFVFLLGKPTLAPVVGGFVEGYPAESAGLLEGDRITVINGTSVTTWDMVNEAIRGSESDAVSIHVMRQDEKLTFSVIPDVVEEVTILGETRMARKVGIFPSDETIFIKYSFFPALQKSAAMVVRFTSLTYQAIFRLVTGRLAPKALSGPLGIMVITSRTAQLGFVYLLQLTGILSISLAIFNLLPIPALDGGHIFFIIIEAILRRPVSFKMQERFSQVGFALLMLLMVFVVYNDAVNFEVWEKIKNAVPFLK